MGMDNLSSCCELPLSKAGGCTPAGSSFCPLPESNKIHHSCSVEGEVQTAASAPHQEKCRGIYRATHSQGKDSAISLSRRPSLLPSHAYLLPASLSLNLQLHSILRHIGWSPAALRFSFFPQVLGSRYPPGNS